VLLTNKYQRMSPCPAGPFLEKALPVPSPYVRDHDVCDHANPTTRWRAARTKPPARDPDLQPAPSTHPQEVDFLYLFARHIEWLQHEEPSAAWDILAAAQSLHGDTRAHARALLASSRQLGGLGQGSGSGRVLKQKRSSMRESERESNMDMNVQFGLETDDHAALPANVYPGFFSGFSVSTLQSLNDVCHQSLLPAGAILFVEGQNPRGMFILCTGKVNLSTTSREGKILILKTAAAGDALGLSAAILGMGYELTAETATSCELSFVDRKHFLELMQSDSDVALHTAQSLSRDFQSAYRDMHDLVLTRSSAGKLARLLLSHSPTPGVEACETRLHSSMTHEEMAQRIGSSRETVTRLLSDLKKKQLIRLDGPTLVIRDRTALQALAV
jgi:CRP/FNR family transcriptional regulator, cyclic AMP receptor protein